MMKNIVTRFGKRTTAFALAGVLLVISMVTAYAFKYPSDPNEVQASLSQAANDKIASQKGQGQNRENPPVPTGLTFQRTNVNAKEFLGYWKFWANADVAKKGNMPLNGSNKVIDIDFTEFDNHYLSCIANHVGLKGKYASGIGTQLGLVSLIHSMGSDDFTGTIPDSHIEDAYAETQHSIFDYAVMRAIEDQSGFKAGDAASDWGYLQRVDREEGY